MATTLTQPLESLSRTADKVLPHGEIREGELTKRIEEQTAKIPSVGYLSLAVGSMVLSAGIAVLSDRDNKWSNFVGLWAPSFLLMGIYNKLVKLEGSDSFSHLSGNRTTSTGNFSGSSSGSSSRSSNA